MEYLNYKGLKHYHDKICDKIQQEEEKVNNMLNVVKTEIEDKLIKHDFTKTTSEAEDMEDGVIYFTTDTHQLLKDGVSYGGTIMAEDAEVAPDDAELSVRFIIPLIDYSSSSLTDYTIRPNRKYLFGTKSSLSITLAEPIDNTIVNCYHFEFTSGSTATTLSLPASVKWTIEPSIRSNKTYQISIENNLGVIQEWT